MAVICSRRSGLRSAARRRGAAAARASRPSPTWLGFAPTCLRARAPRRLPGGAAAEPRWPLLPAPAHIPELSPSASGWAGGSQRWLRRRSGRVRRGGSALGASRRPRGRPCRRSPPGDVAPPRRLPSAEGRARCTGHLGGRLRRQGSNLRNLFAWDLVEPVAYRPVPLALHGFHRRPAQELLPQNAVPAAAEVPPNTASAGAAPHAGSGWLLLRVYAAVTSTRLYRGAAHVTANEGRQVRRCAADAL